MIVRKARASSYQEAHALFAIILCDFPVLGNNLTPANNNIKLID